MIKGYFDDTGAPRLHCTVSIPELGVQDEPLAMLVSTGTSLTSIHPEDAAKMGVDPAKLDKEGYHTPTFKATFTFESQGRNQGKNQDRDQGQEPVHVTLNSLKVITPVNRYLKSTSVLGMDILSMWRMDYSYRDNFLTFSTPD